KRGNEPAVSNVLSLATVLDPDRLLAKLPGPKAAHAIKTKLDLIAASPQADLLRGFWNPEARRARGIIRVIGQQPALDKEMTFKQALALAREPGSFGPTTELTGLSYLLTQTTRGVIATQGTTFVWASWTILATLTIAFRGPKLAVLAMLPTFLSI